MVQVLIPFAILSTIWALSDVISLKTKAVLSTSFVAFTVLLIGTWTNLIPTDIVAKAGLTGIATLSIPLVLIQMGSIISWTQLKSEWKTILITVGGLMVLLVLMSTVGVLVIGKQFALSATPIIFGGGVAALVLTNVIQGLGLENAPLLLGFIWLMTTVQVFVGIPISIFALKRFAAGKLETNTVQELNVALQNPSEKRRVLLPERYQTPFVLIAIAGILGLVGMYFGQYTNKLFMLHEYVLTLIVGFLAVRIGLIPTDIMKKANAYGLLSLTLFIYIGNVITANVSYSVLLQLLKPVILSFTIGVVAIVIGSLIMAKLLKFDKFLAIAVMSSCLSGFPMTILMAEEVSEVMGRNSEEKAIFKSYLVPKMLIAGLFTISFFSGVVASAIGKFL